MAAEELKKEALGEAVELKESSCEIIAGKHRRT